MDDLKILCGDLGGYEADFLYMCTFLSAFEGPMKSPEWTFVGLRGALESNRYDATLKNIMRRCFVLASRNIIGGIDDENDSRMDRAIARLMSDRSLEASFLFGEANFPDLESHGFLSLDYEQRARVVRFIMQSTFESPHLVLQGADVSSSAIVGVDADGSRYFLVKDTSLEVGCWKDIDNHGSVELVATSTDTLITLSNSLRSGTTLPDRTKGTCVYCRKKVPSNVDSYLCAGCSVGACHTKCMPSEEFNGLHWCCSSDCKQFALAHHLRDFANEIEPQQKAAARKKRRIASELSSLQISAKDYGVSESRRRTSTTTRGGRVLGSVDYSFRDYDRAISDAIRKCERKTASEPYSSEEDTAAKESSRSLSRDERMAMRNQRLSQYQHVTHTQEGDINDSVGDIDILMNEPSEDLAPPETDTGSFEQSTDGMDAEQGKLNVDEGANTDISVIPSTETAHQNPQSGDHDGNGSPNELEAPHSSFSTY